MNGATKKFYREAYKPLSLPISLWVVGMSLMMCDTNGMTKFVKITSKFGPSITTKSFGFPKKRNDIFMNLRSDFQRFLSFKLNKVNPFWEKTGYYQQVLKTFFTHWKISC